MAAFYNVASTTVVWRSRASLLEVVSTVDGTELVGLSAIKLAAYQSLLLAGSVDPSKANVRNAFDQVFSAAGGQLTASPGIFVPSQGDRVEFVTSASEVLLRRRSRTGNE
jgi:hypothetical protein